MSKRINLILTLVALSTGIAFAASIGPGNQAAQGAGPTTGATGATASFSFAPTVPAQMAPATISTAITSSTTATGTSTTSTSTTGTGTSNNNNQQNQ